MSIDIVIPVYNAATLLRRCLDALDRHTPVGEAHVTVIDDASPDPQIAPLLDSWRERSPLRPQLLHNPSNLGFVGSVNRGIAATTGDVLLLNADTEVTPDWLRHMRAALAADPRIATVTPFSNNAEICSWPDFCKAAPVPVDSERLARAFAETGTPEYPDLPTAVGFCMLIRRAALQAIGDFDRATFGRGYGEENDFCLRAVAHGWRNVLADNCYVVHAGGGSFAPLGLKPGGDNLARLLARYPRYNAQVAEFIAADPLAGRRAQVSRRYQELCGAERALA